MIAPIGFIAGHWQLIENTEMRCLSLRAAWRLIVGSEPDLSPKGRLVMGMHVPTDDADVRLLLYSSATSEEAVEHAGMLLKLKYDLRDVRFRWRQMSPSPNQWLSEHPSSPIDPAWLTVWPNPSSASVKDCVVLELRGRPGQFIGWKERTVAKVEDALRLPASSAAQGWLRINGIPRQAVQPKWRSVALSEQDERLAAGDAH